jgi:hypothetical protein
MCYRCHLYHTEKGLKSHNYVLSSGYCHQARWGTPVIPALGRQRQEDREFEASLDYIEKNYLKKSKVIK